MYNTLFSMIALIACGVVWRYLRPGGVTAQQARQAITALVYYLLLPALVVDVLWQTPLGVSSLKISAIAATGILAAMLLSWASCRGCRMPDSRTGAVILAASFPNVTYLGLPVLVGLFGGWASSVAIQYDVFAATPLLFTLGILVARYYGSREPVHPAWREFLDIPPLWAALVAVALNLLEVPMPALVQTTLGMLGDSVIPLMLLALGMSLRWEALHWQRLPPVLMIVLIQLLLMPLYVWGAAILLHLEARLLAPMVLEAAMPSMVLGIVLCDRYGLDSGVYAAAVTVTTLFSLVSLPLWYGWLV